MGEDRMAASDTFAARFSISAASSLFGTQEGMTDSEQRRVRLG
jgi:hypothetical protein